MGSRPRWTITTTTTTPTDSTRWDDWKWQLRQAARSEAFVGRELRLTPSERAGLEEAGHRGLAALLTPHMLSLCDPDDADCPIRRQLIPTQAEAERVPGDLVDPLGEEQHEVAPHLVRRYRDRALLLVTATCAVHCRFCTRSRLVRSRSGPVPLSELEPAMSWLQAHSEVREVLVSGGDPLTMSTKRIAQLLRRLRRIPSIEVIRLGTRVPVALPMRVDDELLSALRAFHPLWIMVHVNHVKELSGATQRALERLADAGFPVMSQTVLLRGVNDRAETLRQLFRALIRLRVRPYYLLHGDVVGGASHLRTSLQSTQDLYAALQGDLSGIALPKLVVDTPGGKGKVLLAPEALVDRAPGRTTLRTFRGEHVDLIDPPLRRD